MNPPSSAAPPGARRPDPGEYFEYYGSYVARTPDGDLVATLREQVAVVTATFAPLDEGRASHRYAPGKWSVREVLGHLVDAERVFAHRAVHFARRDPSPLPSFEQDAWLPHARYDERSLASVLDEWCRAREATISLAAALPDEAWDQRGVASGRSFTVRAALWIIPGHVNYHLEHLRAHYGIAAP